MKNLTLAKVLAIVLGLGVVFWLSQTNWTVSQAQSGTIGRYKLHSGDVMYPVPGRASERRAGILKIDTQTGETWVLDPAGNRWARVNQ